MSVATNLPRKRLLICPLDPGSRSTNLNTKLTLPIVGKVHVTYEGRHFTEMML